MKTNSFALGDRNYEGDYNRLLIAGDTKITNSKIRKIYCAGDLDVTKSSIGRMKFAGDLTADSVTIKECKGAGDAKFAGLCKVDSITMIGDIDAEYLECKFMKNGSSSKTVKVNSNSTPTWNGAYKADTFVNYYPLVINGDFDFKNIILYEQLSTKSEIVCENFYLLSDINAECINSENIYIQAAGNISVKTLTGTQVLIATKIKTDSIPKEAKHNLPGKEPNIVNINCIEADQINISHTKSELVCGINVHIGDLCIIERVEYSGSIQISEKAIVNEVIKI